MKIKRFVLMCGLTYYASGGFKDFAGSFDTKEEAETEQKRLFTDEGPYDDSYCWWHICDLEFGYIYGDGGGCNPMEMFK